MREKVKQEYNARIITIPFEKFVTNPKNELKIIADMLNSSLTEQTVAELIKQNVPREKVSDGIGLDIYKRCGFVPPVEGASERKELELRRDEVVKNAGSDAINIIDKMSNEYESIYWDV